VDLASGNHSYCTASCAVGMTVRPLRYTLGLCRAVTNYKTNKITIVWSARQLECSDCKINGQQKHCTSAHNKTVSLSLFVLYPELGEEGQNSSMDPQKSKARQGHTEVP
jgi:hypothetical protein